MAIFVSQSRSVRTTIERIIDLHVREYDLSQITEICNKEELKKLSVHISDYYGLDHPYSLACSIGVVPHYSNLPNGLRIAIEHAFRTKAVGFVVCTSTLAQGVNIPIRYLFMTSFMVSNSSMQIRNFQNLMGRTARSGMYTEGSVIVTDTKIYDQKMIGNMAEIINGVIIFACLMQIALRCERASYATFVVLYLYFFRRYDKIYVRS